METAERLRCLCSRTREPNEARSEDGAEGIMGWREGKKAESWLLLSARLAVERSAGVRRSDTESLLMMSPE